MFDNLRGIISFRAFSAEPDRFINILKSSSVSVRNMRVIKNEITGEVYTYDFKELKNLANKNSIQVDINKKNGLIFTVKRYKKRTGIILGFFLALALIFFLSNTVMVIEVYGNDSISDEYVISILSDYGIHIGSFIPNIDLRRTERKILIAIDDLAWIGIRNTGSRILVEVSERVKYPEMTATMSPCNVVAAYDAQIVGIENLYMGMLVPMLYDGVEEGDILISGIIQTTYGKEYFVHAMGDIIGRYTDKQVFHQSYSDTHINYKDEITKKSLYLFGLRIPLYINKSIKGEYEYDEELSYFNIFNVKLPVGIVYSEYHPYDIVADEYDNETAKEILIEKINLYEKNFLDGEDIKIINKEIQYTIKKDGLSAVVKFTLEGNIGKTQEIFAKK